MATAVPVGRRERFTQWWRLRTRPERLALALAGSAFALALLWLVAWDPMQRDSDRLARRIAEQRTALDEARRQADEIAGLARNEAAPGASDPRAAIEAALARQNLGPAAGALERIDNNHWRLGFDRVAFDALTALLDGLQHDTALRASELSVTARVEPGQVRADATLTR